VATHLKHATPKRIKEVEGRKEKHIPFTPCIFPSSTFALLKFYAEFFFIIFLIYETVFIIFILFEQREVLSKGAWPRPCPSPCPHLRPRLRFRSDFRNLKSFSISFRLLLFISTFSTFSLPHRFFVRCTRNSYSILLLAMACKLFHRLRRGWEKGEREIIRVSAVHGVYDISYKFSNLIFAVCCGI